jgi:hypothetical protein
MNGYMENAQGSLVPVANVKPLDKLRDELVRKLFAEARAEEARRLAFEAGCLKQIADFVALAAQEYKAKLGGEKGNVTLASYDGRMRIVRAMDDLVTFTEGLGIAQSLIGECLARWTKGADPSLAALVAKAFQADKNGNLCAGRILGLLSVKIDDPEWERAMTAICDAIRVNGTKTYLRFYERQSDGSGYRQVNGR